MTEPILKSCCKFNSLATGSIISGMLGIVLAIASMIVLFTVRVDFRTIVFDWFPQWVVRIILAVNLGMTIFISILLIVGVVRVSCFVGGNGSGGPASAIRPSTNSLSSVLVLKSGQ